MTTSLSSGSVWTELTRACKTRGSRRAAVAFLGADAPELLPLRKGDVLVVNASDSALLAGATNPEALSAFVARGVAVLSSPRLHAKIVVTQKALVVGSANASHHSTTMDEAAIITDDPRLIAEAVEFIDGIQGTTVVDQSFLDAAHKTWARRRKSGPPGAGDHPAENPGLLPEPPFRLRVEATHAIAFSDRQLRAIKQEQRKLRRHAGPAASYGLMPYRRPNESHELKKGDVLIQVDSDGESDSLWPPMTVLSDPIDIGRGKSHLVILRDPLDLTPISVSDATAHLVTAGVRITPRLFADRWLRGQTKDALLSLWYAN